MKVLMISGDRDTLNPQSDTGKRMAEYREAFGELDILLAYGGVFSLFVALLKGLFMIWKKRPDVITAQDTEHALLAYIFSKLFRVSWQMQIHTDIMSPYFKEQSLKNKIRVMLAKFLVPRASCVRVVSDRIKRSLVKLNKNLDKPDKVTVLPIFVDVERIKNAPIQTDLHKKYPGRFIILMASRITKEKNIGLALDAIRDANIRMHANGANKKILLLVVGDGPEVENLKFQVYKLGLGDNVIFEERTSDIISYFKTCDLFLLTSNYEGYGMTLIEAAATGAKIISSDVGIALEILDRENIFKVGDKEDLKEKLIVAIRGQLSPPKSIPAQTKEEYLKLYKESFKLCGGKKP